MRAVKLEAVIPENRQLTLTVPAEIPSGPVEVVILAKDEPESRQGAFVAFLDELKARPARYSTEEIEAHVQETRNAWDE
jgi:hypothetical protein